MFIACPKCDWRPDANSLWQCGCRHLWNTFQTHGVCPACSRDWEETQCHVCDLWSDHADWYHDDDGLTVDEYLANPAPASRPTLMWRAQRIIPEDRDQLGQPYRIGL